MNDNGSDIDWMQELDESHEYGLAMDIRSVDFEQLNKYKFRYIKLLTGEIENFDLQHPELLQTLYLQGFGNDHLIAPCLDQFVNVKQLGIACIDSFDVKSLQYMKHLQ